METTLGDSETKKKSAAAKSSRTVFDATLVSSRAWPNKAVINLTLSRLLIGPHTHTNAGSKDKAGTTSRKCLSMQYDSIMEGVVARHNCISSHKLQYHRKRCLVILNWYGASKKIVF